MRVSIRVEGAAKLAGKLNGASGIVRSELQTPLTIGSLLVEGSARQKAPHDTGRLGGSITHRITGLESRIGPSARYGLYVEYGRRPGRMPPVRAIEPWARRHGLNAFAVARAIARKGTKAHPFMKPALEDNRARIIALFRRAGQALVARLAD